MCDVIFNCTTNNSGGAIQNAVNFIRSVHEDDVGNIKFFWFLSPEVYFQVRSLISDNFIVFKSPAKSLSARNDMLKMEKKLAPKLVYTSAGPAYVDFSAYHIMGISNPYILGANKYAMKLIDSRLDFIKRKLRTIYQLAYAKKADEYIAQTELSKEQISNIVGNKRVHVVSNAISEDFLNFYNNHIDGDYKEIDGIAKILVPSAYYKHKDLERLPRIIRDYNIKFNSSIKVTLTISEEKYNKYIHPLISAHNVEAYFNNIGSYDHKSACEIYSNHDVILQPSALEVFSTSYLEAMATIKPLVVPDLNFSRSICDSYPFYYEINSIDSCVSSLREAILSGVSSERKHNASGLLKSYSTQSVRAKKLLSIIEKVMRDIKYV